MESKFGERTVSPGAFNFLVVHSGKERAKQTAAHLSEVLILSGCTCIGDAEDSDALSPNADTEIAMHLMQSLPLQRAMAYSERREVRNQPLDAVRSNPLLTRSYPLLAAPDSTLIVLVGHLPHLHKFAAALGVAADAEQFTPAGGLLLERSGDAWVRVAVVDQSRWFESTGTTT